MHWYPVQEKLIVSVHMNTVYRLGYTSTPLLHHPSPLPPSLTGNLCQEPVRYGQSPSPLGFCKDHHQSKLTNVNFICQLFNIETKANDPIIRDSVITFTRRTILPLTLMVTSTHIVETSVTVTVDSSLRDKPLRTGSSYHTDVLNLFVSNKATYRQLTARLSTCW